MKHNKIQLNKINHDQTHFYTIINEIKTKYNFFNTNVAEFKFFNKNDMKKKREIKRISENYLPFVNIKKKTKYLAPIYNKNQKREAFEKKSEINVLNFGITENETEKKLEKIYFDMQEKELELINKKNCIILKSHTLLNAIKSLNNN